MRRTRTGGPNKVGNVTARTCTQEEWSKLTKDEREKVKELRKSQKRRATEDPVRRMLQLYNKKMMRAMMILLTVTNHPVGTQMKRVTYLC